MRCKNAFSPSADDPGIDTGPGITEQHHKERVDVNNIINKYALTGQLPNGNSPDLGVYGDFTDVGDFLSAKLRVIEAENAFMQLDAKVRQRFQNDPAQLLTFIQDPQNLEEAIKLGLAISKPITPVQDKKTSEPSLDQTSK